MNQPQAHAYKYQAFLSYSHAADHVLAPALQTALQNFARPNYLSRSMNVFCDKTELSANPALWPRIQTALSESKFFVLLASPSAANSRWVQREIQSWLQLHKNSVDDFLIVWTDGDLPWDPTTGACDWTKSTALPAELELDSYSQHETRFTDLFVEEPFYLDLRKVKDSSDLSLQNPLFLDGVATLAATLLDRRKSELFGEDASRLRKYRRIRTSIISLLLVLLVVASGAALIARQQSNRAEQALGRETQAKETAQNALVSEQIAKKEALDRKKDAEDALVKVKQANEETKVALANETIAKNQAEAKRIEAEQQTQIALSRQLTAQAQSMRTQRTDSLPLSMLLAVESLRRSPSLEDDQLLRSGLSLLPKPLQQLPTIARGKVTAIAHEPIENCIAISVEDSADNLENASSSVQIWRLSNNQLIHELPAIKGIIQALRFDAKGDRLVGLTTNNEIISWIRSENWMPKRFSIRDRVPGGLGMNPVVLSADGRLVGVRYSNHAAAVISTENQKFVRQPFWHPDSVIAMSFSANNKWFATASASDVWLWNLDSEEPLISIHHRSPIRTLSFSSDGFFLAVGSDGGASIYSTKNPKSFREIVKGQLVYKLAFSPDGRFLASASVTSGIQVWELSEDKIQSRMSQRGDIVELFFSPNNRELCSIDQNNVIRMWDIKKNDREVARVSYVRNPETFVFGLDGESFITAAEDSTVRVWQSSSQQELARMNIGTLVRVIAYSPNAQYLASSAVDDNLRLFEMPTGKELNHVRLGYSVNGLTFSGDSQKLAIFIRPQIEIFSVPNLKSIWKISYEPGISKIAFSTSGRYLVAMGSDHTVNIWDIQTQSPVKRSSQPQNITTFAVSSNDKYLGTAAEDGVARITELFSGKEVARIQNVGPASNVLFSKSTRYFACTSANNTVFIYDLLKKRQIVHSIENTANSFIAFSPDDTRFAIASGKIVAIHDIQTGREDGRLEHVGPIQSIAFSPDGKFFATRIAGVRLSEEAALLEMIWWKVRSDPMTTQAFLSDEYNALRIFETHSWTEVARLAHDSEITKFEFSPDSRYVATGSEQGTRVFFLHPRDLIKASRTRLVYNLSELEWRKYISPNKYRPTFPDLPIPQR